MEPILEIMAASWHVFVETAIYMLFGFFVAGILNIFFKPSIVSRYLGKGKVRSVFLSALVGVPIPLCSCGVVPAAAGLKQQGANSGATLSFMIATPESGIDSIAVTYALLDPFMTIIRPVAAFLTAIIAGITENFFGIREHLSGSHVHHECCSDHNCSSNGIFLNENKDGRLSFFSKCKIGLKYAFLDLLGDIGRWFLVGILLAGLISYYVPEHFIESNLGSGLSAMLIMLVAGIPMYVCSTASTPIAAALIIKGLNPGAALVFLLVGPATNIASLTMVSGILGSRALFIYLASIVLCSLGLGVFTDMFYNGMGIQAKAVAGQAAQIIPHNIEIVSAGILTVLLVFAIWKRQKSHGAHHNSCEHH